MSITQVAKVAGVSHATVSNVINRRPSVSPATVAAVRKAMAEIGYTPRPVTNRPGRRPRSADGVFTGRISMVWPQRSSYHNPVALGIMQGISGELDALGFDLTISFAGADNVAQVVERADGLLALGFLEKRLIRSLRGKPIVWIGSHGPLDWGDRVRCDHGQIAREAAGYLVDQGCSSLAFVALDELHPAVQQRGAAFRIECDRLGLPVELIQVRDGSTAAAAAALSRLKNIDLTGIFVANDRHLAALDRACRMAGLTTLSDRPVIGCDNEPAALAGLIPTPATFDLRPEQLGRLAVRRLAERMRGHGGQGQVTITQSAQLIEPPPFP
jgi:DNA-binding LacI/PurR family transcriptional regulator